jgi:hypothetical protein
MCGLSVGSFSYRSENVAVLAEAPRRADNITYLGGGQEL